MPDPSYNRDMANIELGEFSLERMFHAVEKVRERLLRATAALDDAGVPYAVIGGHAVAAWVSKVDEALVRNTQDVDLLVRRRNLAPHVQPWNGPDSSGDTPLESTCFWTGRIQKNVMPCTSFLPTRRSTRRTCIRPPTSCRPT